MAATATRSSIPLGSYAATVVYSSVLMGRMIKRRTFVNNLSGPVPMDEWQKSIGNKNTTTPGMPIVQISDLAKMSGDRVTADILDRIGGKPIVGDKIAKNTGVKISHLRDEVTIDQLRKVIDVGGRMSQQRTPHDLRMNGRNLAMDYYGDLMDNIAQVQFAGLRGVAQGIEWKVPLASDADFADIMVNPVLPPTRSRYVGLSSSVGDPTQVSTSNILTLNFFDDLRTINDTSPVPLQPVKMMGMMDEMVEGERESLLVAMISTEQWNQLQKQTSDQNWRTFLSDATTRLSPMKHPLFRNGMCGIWRDILICQMPRPIQLLGASVNGYMPGYNSVSYYDAAGMLQTGTIAANVRLQRGVLLGAQGLALAYGNAERWSGGDAGTRGSGRTQAPVNVPYSWVEKLEDGDNLLQLFIGAMFGMKKLRYTFENELYDNGVFAFDTHVPALR